MPAFPWICEKQQEIQDPKKQTHLMREAGEHLWFRNYRMHSTAACRQGSWHLIPASSSLCPTDLHRPKAPMVTENIQLPTLGNLLLGSAACGEREIPSLLNEAGLSWAFSKHTEARGGFLCAVWEVACEPQGNQGDIPNSRGTAECSLS